MENLSIQNSKNFLDFTIKNLADLFGASEDELLKYCNEEIKSYNFCYRKLEDIERDQLILKILKYIDSEDLVSAGVERQSDWEKGWNENLQEFTESEYDINKLVPKYFKKNVPVRLNKNYVMPEDENFVLNITNTFRSWLFKKYFQEVDSIYEFGCGPAVHLAYLATIFPEKRLYGFDWTKSSKQIINLLSQHYGWSIKGDYFNFFNPNKTIKIDPNSAIFTFGALEQVGKKHGPFLEFLLEKSPELCINIEGLHEFYDEKYLTDFLALKYHKRRGYLDGYLTHLKKLAKEKKIDIIKVHHQQFGNQVDDPHSYVIWRPIKRGTN